MSPEDRILDDERLTVGRHIERLVLEAIRLRGNAERSLAGSPWRRIACAYEDAIGCLRRAWYNQETAIDRIREEVAAPGGQVAGDDARVLPRSSAGGP